MPSDGSRRVRQMWLWIVVMGLSNPSGQSGRVYSVATSEFFIVAGWLGR